MLLQHHLSATDLNPGTYPNTYLPLTLLTLTFVLIFSTFAQTVHRSQLEINVQQMTSDFNDVTDCVHFEGRISHASFKVSVALTWLKLIDVVNTADWR